MRRPLRDQRLGAWVRIMRVQASLGRRFQIAGDQFVMAVGAPTAIGTRVWAVVFMVDSKAAKRSICWPPAGKL